MLQAYPTKFYSAIGGSQGAALAKNMNDMLANRFFRIFSTSQVILARCTLNELLRTELCGSMINL